MITTGMASLHLVDQATLEMFVALLLDENENSGPSDEKVFEYEPEIQEGDEDEDEGGCVSAEIVDSWLTITEVGEEAEFVTGQEIPGTDLAISLRKRRNAFSITLYRPDFDLDVQNSNSEEEAYLSVPGALEFRVDPLAGDSTVAKVVREHGLSYVVVFVKVQGEQSVVKVVSLAPGSIRTRFKMTYIDNRRAEGSESDMGVRSELENASLMLPPRTALNSTAPIYTAQDLQASTVDALRRHYGAQAMKQALRIISDQKRTIEIARDEEYQPPTIFEKMLDEPPSVHQTRLINNYLSLLDTRTVVLHRKRFFDDQYEKLIIMAVQLKFYQKE